MQPGLAGKHLNRNDVPNVHRHNVCSNEVDLSFTVGPVVPSSPDRVFPDPEKARELHLHSPESTAYPDEHVKRATVSPRLRNLEIEAARSGNEGGLGGFPANLA